jgi:hypothetical protein
VPRLLTPVSCDPLPRARRPAPGRPWGWPGWAGAASRCRGGRESGADRTQRLGVWGPPVSCHPRRPRHTPLRDDTAGLRHPARRPRHTPLRDDAAGLRQPALCCCCLDAAVERVQHCICLLQAEGDGGAGRGRGSPTPALLLPLRGLPTGPTRLVAQALHFQGGRAAAWRCAVVGWRSRRPAPAGAGAGVGVVRAGARGAPAPPRGHDDWNKVKGQGGRASWVEGAAIVACCYNPS